MCVIIELWNAHDNKIFVVKILLLHRDKCLLGRVNVRKN